MLTPNESVGAQCAAGGPSIPTQWSDERYLVARLRAGDDKAFEILVRDHGGRMLSVVRRLLIAEDDARDALQDAFVQVFRSVGDFQGQCSLSTWLYRVALNSALMKIRGVRRRPETSIEELIPAFDDTGHRIQPVAYLERTPESELMSEQTRALVRAGIDRLPDTYRTVLILRDLEERSTHETADILGINESAVKVRLHRARKALATVLAGAEDARG